VFNIQSEKLNVMCSGLSVRCLNFRVNVSSLGLTIRVLGN
jgi:hypothetical protein